MKTLHVPLAALLTTMLASCSAHGQTDKLKSDVTYSTHNYKHPNKAAQARQWENGSSVSVKPISTQQLAQANYKHQHTTGSTREGGITVPHQPSATLADRHYKTKYWMKVEPKPEVAKKSAPDYPTNGN